MALIAAAHEQRTTNATAPNADQLAGTPVVAPNETPPPAVAAPTEAMPEMGTNAGPSAPAEPLAGPDRAQSSSNAVRSYRETDAARRALSAEMRQVRMAAIAGASTNKPAPGAVFTAPQRQALQAFVVVAGSLSAALAADDLTTANDCVTHLPSVLLPLQKATGADHPYSGPIQRLVSLQWRPSQNLTTAREQFLPFSTATVDLAKGLRKEDPAFAGLKIYHCPMAPKPGLWMQSKGPLANPFYGAKMLTCGEEVKS
jgi:hypothetical protein